MKFLDFLKRAFSSPLKIVAKIVRYFAKFFMFGLFSTCVGLFAAMFNDQLILDLSLVVSAYGFFGAWTYLERLYNSDEETDYTEVLGKRGFSFSYEFKDVLRKFKWNILLETFVFYIVISCFLPTISTLIQYQGILIISTTASYFAVPVLNVIIWVAVRKHWHKKYRRWARHKQTQEFVDNSYPDVTESEE